MCLLKVEWERRTWDNYESGMFQGLVEERRKVLLEEAEEVIGKIEELGWRGQEINEQVLGKF